MFLSFKACVRKHGRVWQTLKSSLTKGTTPNVIAGGDYTVCHPGERVTTVSPDIHIIFNHSCFKPRCMRKIHSEVAMDFLAFLLGLENETEITEAEHVQY